MNVPNKTWLMEVWNGNPYDLADLLTLRYGVKLNRAKIVEIWQLYTGADLIHVFNFARHILDCEREWNPAPPFEPTEGWV